MTIPTECKMPTLSGLDSPLMNRLIVQLLIGEKGISRNVSLYRKNFIRYIDQAIKEYDYAREDCLAILKGNPNERIGFMLEFTNHIEICILNVRRLYRLLDRIKSETKDSPLLPKELRRLLETQRQPIIDIRGAAEHIDDCIQKGEVAKGSPIMLTINKTEDGVVVADYEIKFKELALVLEKMNEIAQYILTIKKVNTSHSN